MTTSTAAGQYSAPPEFGLKGLSKQLWKSALVSGILTLVVGGLVLASPAASIQVAATLFGVFLLGTGLAQTFFAFTIPASTAGRALLFITGALSVVLATFSFRHFGDAYAVLLLSIWIGVAFVFQGVAETVTAAALPELPGRGWYVFGGIITWIAGLVVLAWPFDSIAVLTLVVGAWLIAIGALQIVRALQVRKELNRTLQLPDELADA